MSLDDSTFLASIHDPVLQAKYRRDLASIIKQAKREHRIGRKKFKDSLEEEISDRENHDEMVDISIFPFVQLTALTKLGYKLRACDPMYETGKRNFDFLVVRYTDRYVSVLLGEAKTSRSHSARIVKEINEKAQIIEDNEDYFRRTYLDGTKLPIQFEFIAVVYPDFSDDIRDSLDEYYRECDKNSVKSRKVVVWQVNRHDCIVDIMNPGHGKYQLRMRHSDNKLNAMLRNLKVLSRNAFGFFPQSHEVTKMKVIIEAIEHLKYLKLGGHQEFETSEIDEFFAIRLFYLKESDRKNERDKILKNLEKIGLIEWKGPKTFAIKAEYSGGSTKDKLVTHLWSEDRSKRSLEYAMDEAKRQLQDSIRKEYDSRPRLDRFT